MLEPIQPTITEREAELKPGTIVDYAITFSGRKCIPYVEAISEQGFDGATQYTGVTEHHALSEAFENLTYIWTVLYSIVGAKPAIC